MVLTSECQNKAEIKVWVHSQFDMLSKLMNKRHTIKLYLSICKFFYKKTSDRGHWFFIRLKTKIKLEYEVLDLDRFYLGQIAMVCWLRRFCCIGWYRHTLLLKFLIAYRLISLCTYEILALALQPWCCLPLVQHTAHYLPLEWLFRALLG